MSNIFEKPIEAEKNRLWSELYDLKDQCKSTLNLIVKTRLDDYRNTAKILLWTKDAKAIEGFYEGLIAASGNSRTRTETHAHNYAPLLTILFENLLSDQDKNKLSRALNMLDKEYTNNSEIYATDAVNKLANFILKQGGFVKLIKPTYNKSDLKNAAEYEEVDENNIDAFEKRLAEEAARTESTESGHGISYKRVKPILSKSAFEMLSIKDETVKDKVLEEAVSFMNVSLMARKAKFDAPLNQTDEGYSVALVKNNGKSITYINSFNDDRIVSDGIFGSYRSDFTATPKSIRFLCEAIRTQSLPPKLKLVARDLYEVVREKTEQEPALLARPRLIYRQDSGDFVLSSMHLLSSVVTTVIPHTQVLEAKEYDIVLSTPSMAFVERLLIMGLGVNFFKPDSTEQIPALSTDDVYSHSLRLTHKADNTKNFHMTFHGVNSDQESVSQPVSKVSYEEAEQAAIKVSATVASAVSSQYADPWMAAIDKHITRSANQIMQVMMTGTHIKFRYFSEGHDFKGQYSILHSPDGESEKVFFKGEFLTADLMPVLGSLGHLPITTEVGFKVINGALFITYGTSAAKLCIAIPTFIRADKKRSVAAFSSYTPKKKQLTKEQLWEQSMDGVSDADFSWEYTPNQFEEITYGEVENV
jgi:hypothetical protein